MSGADDVLASTAGMPERRLAAGEVLFDQGADGSASVAVLVEGSLRIDLGSTHLSDVTAPGSFVGEIGALLGTERTASVVARGPATVRVIGDPEAFFATHPEVALELARQLAGRLHRLLAYLDDLREQYADQGGHVALVDSVLSRLASRPSIEIEPGSDRSPDY